MIINAVQSNPEQFESEAAQMELSAQLQKLDMDLADVSGQLQMITEQKFMEDTTIPLNEFFGETSEPMQNTDEYYNPQLLMAQNGAETFYPNTPGSSADPGYVVPQSDFNYAVDENGNNVSVNPYNNNRAANGDSDFEDKIKSGVGTHTAFTDIMDLEC